MRIRIRIRVRIRMRIRISEDNKDNVKDKEHHDVQMSSIAAVKGQGYIE